ncbi:MAG: molybdopterin-dependent oxidoreductase [Acidobacteriia bacterium]|nr:molybdopterin-dependent oxidoreductase [Terriglobia bacterium]
MGDEKSKVFETPDSASGLSLDRRDFFKLVGGGIIVWFTLDEAVLLGQRGPSYPADLNAYLKIGENGRVTVYSGKIEMGQGVVTSLAQEAADELGVALESIDMVMGDTDLCPPDSGTYGSMSTRFFGPWVRAAAAEARDILLDLAAEQLKTPKEKLSVEAGAVFVTADKKTRVTFAQLAKGQKIMRKTQAAPLSATKFQAPPAHPTLMGKATKRTDAVAKVTGKAKYAGDMREPGMLYARILRPPAHGATLKSVNTSAAEKMPGIIVVNQEGLIAVLHQDPEAAEKALASIKAEFNIPVPAVDNLTIFDHILKSSPRAQENDARGDLTAGEKAAATVFEGKYVTAYGAHAPIETHTALAKIEGGKATVWISTQGPFPNQRQIVQALGFTPENVRVITPFVGGGFGGKNPAPQAVEAARLAKITGKPVQVMFSRAEEFFYDTYRPAGVVKIKSGITAAGKICLWDYNVYAAGARSSEQFYDVPNSIIRVYGQGMGGGGSVHPFGTGAWRAPGAPVNVFARESQIDIMAASAKMDPLEFRLNNTSDLRMRTVLQAAADQFPWKKAAAPSGRGYGIACGIDAETYVAQIVEVAVDKASGKVKVKRVVCAQDMGFAVNPEGAKMQMEGCITMGLGYTLSEDISFKGGQIFTTNFDTYEIPHFSGVPAIEAILVKNDELAPKGGGEPAIVPLGGAVANAIFDASGARLYQFPMTPERIKEALKKA